MVSLCYLFSNEIKNMPAMVMFFFEDDLLAAEQRARQHSLGLFSSATGLRRIVDMTLSHNKERAKNVLTILKLHGRMEGVVECVISGSRFRVHLLKDDWIISFFLSAINCPRVERRKTSNVDTAHNQMEAGEPFGIEALNFSREHYLQRYMTRLCIYTYICINELK
jgi:hypothetical protein